MAINTIQVFDLDGTAVRFPVPFEYLARKFVKVTLLGTSRKPLTLVTEFVFEGSAKIRTLTAWGPADGYTQIEVRRETSASERIVDFNDATILRAQDLDTSTIQSLHVAEEARNSIADVLGIDENGNLDARFRRIVNVADPVAPGDAINKRVYDADIAGVAQARQAAEAARVGSEQARMEAQLAAIQAQQSAVSVQTLRADMASPNGGLLMQIVPGKNGVPMSVQSHARRQPRSLFDYMTDEMVADVQGASVMDHTAAVLKAIAECPRQGIIFAYQGKYNIRGTGLTFGLETGAAHLIGVGNPTFHFLGLANTVDCVSLAGSSYMPTTLEDVTLLCNFTGRVGVRLTNGDHPRVRRVKIVESFSDAFSVDVTGYSWVENLFAEDVQCVSSGRHFVSLITRGDKGAFINESRFVGIEGRTCSLKANGGVFFYCYNEGVANSKLSELQFLSCNADANRAAAVAAGFDIGPNPFTLAYAGFGRNNRFENFTITGGAWESISMPDYRSHGLVYAESGVIATGFNMKLGVTSGWSVGGIKGGLAGYTLHTSEGIWRTSYPNSWKQMGMAASTSYAIDVPFPTIPIPASSDVNPGAVYALEVFSMSYPGSELQTYDQRFYLAYNNGTQQYWVQWKTPVLSGPSGWTVNSVSVLNRQAGTGPHTATEPPYAVRLSVTASATWGTGGRSAAIRGVMTHVGSTTDQFSR